MSDKASVTTIKFNDIDTKENLSALAHQYQGEWDGKTLHIDHEQFKLDIHCFSYMRMVSIDLCEASVYQPVTFVQAPESEEDFIYIRLGFSGTIVNAPLPDEFHSNGIFIYNSSQHFEVDFPAGVNDRWIVIKFPKRLYYEFFEREETKLKQILDDTEPWFHYLPLNAEIEEYIKIIFQNGVSPHGRKIAPFSKALDTISAITEQLEAEEPGNIQKRIHPTDLRIIISIKDQILGSLDNLPKLDDLSEEHGMSVSKIHRLFKHVFKMPVLKFYNQQKVELLRQKIQHTDDSLTNIAADLGFSHVAHMSRVFKKHYGYAPSALRRA
ncbi:AraC family transcriptional regulator [Persicobacter diffluens]|uniref:HTH araC/xylS-type domain-containing protein n=1 Tax=Persicobacter diffluens TaxID=981 RepID=A0AAN4W2N3_9BACT|nr:hypothetical protein PEDI_51180 [Persicobacter diffluens]